MKKTDICIIGAGPAGIFTALELLRQNSKKRIVIVEKGKPVEKRKCPKAETKECINCRPYCNITTGFSGAGAFSDGKLSLSYEVGGDLPSLIGEEFAQEMIRYTDGIYLEFGADTKVEGVGNEAEVRDIRKRAIQAGLKLVDCPIRHLGTEKAQEIYYEIEQYLLNHGVEILFGWHCRDLIVEQGACKGAVIETSARHEEEQTVYAEHVVVAAGRKGADWLEGLCESHGIEHQPGTVDIGVRVEVRNEIMEDVNNILYESKLIGYPLPFKNKDCRIPWRRFLFTWEKYAYSAVVTQASARASRGFTARASRQNRAIQRKYSFRLGSSRRESFLLFMEMLLLRKTYRL